MRFRDWVTAISGLAALAVSIFAVGGVLRWAQALIAFLVAISLGFALISRRGLARVSPLVAVLGLAFVLTAIQLIPLPDSLVEALSPTSVALRNDGAGLLDVSASSTITNDRPATLGALISFLTLLGIAFVA